MLEKLDNGVRFCAHNGKEFDYPYMSRRMLTAVVATSPSLLKNHGKSIIYHGALEIWRL